MRCLEIRQIHRLTPMDRATLPHAQSTWCTLVDAERIECNQLATIVGYVRHRRQVLSIIGRRISLVYVALDDVGHTAVKFSNFTMSYKVTERSALIFGYILMSLKYSHTLRETWMQKNSSICAAISIPNWRVINRQTDRQTNTPQHHIPR